MNKIEAYVRKYEIEIVYDQLYSENIKISTSTVSLVRKYMYNNKFISGIDKEDYLTIINLFRAWNFVFNTLDHDINYYDICLCNAIVSTHKNTLPGVLRNTNVFVKTNLDHDYYPQIPDELEVKEKINQINEIEDIFERGLELFCYLCKAQLFEDGNKRTAFFITSRLFMKHELCIIKPPQNLIIDHGETFDVIQDNDLIFKKALVEYYLDESKKENLKDIIRSYCCFSYDIDALRDRNTFKVDPEDVKKLLCSL